VCERVAWIRFEGVGFGASDHGVLLHWR
jgi:hypothetical protein